jgi:serine/threonine-protein kinase PpkA
MDQSGATMARKSGRCGNYDGCGKALSHALIEADEFNFVCPECGKPLRPLLRSTPGTGPNWPLIGALALATTGAIGGIGYALWPSDDQSEPTPRSTPPAHYSAPPSPPVSPTAPITTASAPDSARCTPRPLLMAGKRTLFQRILTRPGAVLAKKPDDYDGDPQPPLTRFYVYQRQARGRDEWLQVGSTANCRSEGWMRAEHTVPWKQQITVAFDNPAGRDRVLLFRDAVDVARILESANPARQLDPLLASVQAQRTDPRIIAAEPENYVDFTQKFYLLPIVDFKKTNNHNDIPLHLLRIHSISQNGEAPPPPPKPEYPKAAVVFVIDSTISMKPYIDRTKLAVRQIFDQLRGSPGGDNIHFGLVAFRSSVKAVPGLDYVARLFVDPNQPDNDRTFLAGIDRVEEARVSSAKFDEDAYAGLMLALDKIDWSPYLARHVVLITDAGALDAGDSLSQTRKAAGEVLAIARDHKAFLYAIHLKTPAGVNDHAKAEHQYRQLTHNTLTGEPLYYDVRNAGDIADFGASIDCLSRSMTHNILSLGKGRDGLDNACPPRPGNHTLNQQLDRMHRHAELLGHALRLEYLGLLPEGQGAPPDFEGWISDRDLKNPIRPNVEVKVLLTKNELSNLTNGVKVILDAALAGRSSPEAFFRSLSSYIGQIGNDPQLAKPQENITVAEMGLLGEYLDDLPYKSTVMALDENTWNNWSASQQDEFIRTIQNKLERYQYYEGDCKLWTDLSKPPPKDGRQDNCDGTTGDSGDKVYPIPLDALP